MPTFLADNGGGGGGVLGSALRSDVASRAARATQTHGNLRGPSVHFWLSGRRLPAVACN